MVDEEAYIKLPTPLPFVDDPLNVCETSHIFAKLCGRKTPPASCSVFGEQSSNRMGIKNHWSTASPSSSELGFMMTVPTTRSSSGSIPVEVTSVPIGSTAGISASFFASAMPAT